MKKVTILFLTYIFVPIFAVAQTIENIDFISPFHNNLAAIKKDGKWAFINKEGNLIIDFRTDLVITKTDDGDYPMFNNDRCKIVEIKAGISYFGFIDETGKIVVEPRFLNTTNFKNGTAIALEVIKKVITKNTALGKDIVNYRYFETIIDTNGKVIYYLNEEGVNVVLDKDFLRKIPVISSKYLTEDLYAIKNKNRTWNIFQIRVKI